MYTIIHTLFVVLLQITQKVNDQYGPLINPLGCVSIYVYHQSNQYEEGDYLRIGSVGHPLTKWLTSYKEIAAEHIGPDCDYTEKQIEQTYQMMLFIQKYIKNNK